MIKAGSLVFTAVLLLLFACPAWADGVFSGDFDVVLVAQGCRDKSQPATWVSGVLDTGGTAVFPKCLGFKEYMKEKGLTLMGGSVDPQNGKVILYGNWSKKRDK